MAHDLRKRDEVYWALQRHNLRLRLKHDEHTWMLHPFTLVHREVLTRSFVPDCVYKQLAARLGDFVALAPEGIVEVTVGDEVDLLVAAGVADTLDRLERPVYALLARVVGWHAYWINPPRLERLDLEAWGRELAEQFPISLRRLLEHSEGRGMLFELLNEERSDDLGYDMPQVLDERMIEELIDHIYTALRSTDKECESFVSQWKSMPWEADDYVALRWDDADTRPHLKDWCRFLASLSLSMEAWTLVATNAKAFDLFCTFPLADEIAPYDALLSRAIELQLSRKRESWWVSPAEESHEDRTIFTAFRLMFDNARKPEFRAAGLRDVDRLLLLFAYDVESHKKRAALLATLFWQNLAPELIEEWLRLFGDELLCYGIREHLCYKDRVLDFWAAIATSGRDDATKTELFEMALELLRLHSRRELIKHDRPYAFYSEVMAEVNAVK